MTALAPTEHFSHEPLHPSKREIRLCRILPPSPKEDPIRCEITHHELEPDVDPYHPLYAAERYPEFSEPHRSSLNYTAVSYVWGEPGNEVLILVNDRTFAIRPNLATFLTIAQAQMTRPGVEHETVFWIDQLCINQQDVAERNSQVQLMSSIYTQARAVYAWLGDGKPETRLAIEVFRDLELREPYYAMDMWGTDGHVRPCYTADEKTREQLVAFVEYLTTEYWTRVWITQEVFLAPELYLICGRWKLPVKHAEGGGGNMVHYRGMIPSIENAIGKELPVINGRPWLQTLDIFKQSIELLHLRQKRGHLSGAVQGTGDAYLDLLPAVTFQATRHCADIRDKVFGIQACVHPDRRVVVDYNATPLQVYYNLLERALLTCANWSPSPRVFDYRGEKGPIVHMATRFRSTLRLPELNHEHLSDIVAKIQVPELPQQDYSSNQSAEDYKQVVQKAAEECVRKLIGEVRRLDQAGPANLKETEKE